VTFNLFLFDSEDFRQADQIAMNELHLPALLLMENAGRAAADVIVRRFPFARKILVVCGSGNNGGDGFVTARHLRRRSIDITALISSSIERISGEPLLNLKALHGIGVDIQESGALSEDELKSLLGSQDLLVDALLGTGSKGAPRGEILRIIRSMRGSAPVVSLDIPSGVDPSTGKTEGEVVNAVLTVTMLARKTGLEIMPGRGLRGDIEVVDIGVPPEFLLRRNSSHTLIEGADVSVMLPPRGSGVHKGDRGLVLVIGGSSRYGGAPVLSALGALMCGCGGVVVAAPARVCAQSMCHPEMIFMEGVSEGGFLSSRTWDAALDMWGDRIDSVVIGPGLDRGEPSRELFRRVWNEWKGPLCVDGDALFALGRWPERPCRPENSVITPHEGEAANMLAKERRSISSSRLGSVLELSGLFGTTLLKGAATIISDGNRVRVIPFIVPGLSIPGSGDVLAGVIGALLGMGLDAFDAATSAAYLHALAGRELEHDIGIDGISAAGVASAIPRAISIVRLENGECRL